MNKSIAYHTVFPHCVCRVAVIMWPSGDNKEIFSLLTDSFCVMPST